ncbi:hypothetical protein N7495_005883 [Penicillium taxi]|uniref:uncharacterized protein n=1 Tax=Penicillium taxi TaxID=168475 RepID=UPI00254540E6|nr:uncharacterized protein N7495_005883 [Penicillium taxi]KAJ5894192.1 hypothetical protein N7495_005883 [Penicillium taxi]
MSTFQSSSQAYHGQSTTSRTIPAFNPVAVATAPAGTLLPGTKVQVGSHRVVVEKYLSEGGFAHVYVVRLPQPINGSETAVLKRVAVPDKSALANMRTEVETMKKLQGHRHIVKYIDSHASQLRGGGYEVFLIMEFCAGGGLIDFMNTRLQNRLTEPEIIKIFSDVAEGVACMHYLKPPLLHRDLKVENILISNSAGSTTYKLCDFGSSAPPRPAATSAAEGRLIEDDVQRHTTLQYRSPEMIDVYRKQPIDEKSDIWALGVLLYKLCYYTTPFEEVGQMAILNASFKYPAYPQFSSRLKMFIGSMLKEDPRQRPNIYDVVLQICRMQGKEVPIRDIYSNRSVSQDRRNQELPATPAEAPKVGAVFSVPLQETQITIPEIAPMRRGRPGKSQSSTHSAKASPSPFRGSSKTRSSDPFAALDGGRGKKTADELSSRFPTLDQFDILHEQGDKFDFEPGAKDSSSEDEELSKRLTNALADKAFARQTSPERRDPSRNRRSQLSPVRSQSSNEVAPSLPARQPAPLYQPTPQRPSMVSTGTMTSPAPTPRLQEPAPRSQEPKVSTRPIYRFPVGEPEPEQKTVPSPTSLGLKPEPNPRVSSDRLSNHSQSARPSMEGLRRPSGLEIEDPVGRPKSVIAKTRPMSVQPGAYTEPESYRSSLDMVRVQYEDGVPLRNVRTEMDQDYERPNISDMDYLRVKEVEESNRKREKRFSGSHKHSKRGSLSALSLSGGKNMLAGRFGEAFRRFESSNPDKSSTPSPEALPSPDNLGLQTDMLSAYEDVLEDVDRDDISPEMRRELERRRLSQEEKRVTNAAAEFRRRAADGGGGRAGTDGQRSRAIQNRVQTLFSGSNKSTAPKTASGYGKYTDNSPTLQAKQDEVKSSATGTALPPKAPDSGYGFKEGTAMAPPLDRREGASAPGGLPQSATSTTSYQSAPRPVSRPTAPPKPKKLQVGTQNTSLPGTRPGTGQQQTPMSPGEDYEANFSRRFPSLSGLEMETEIEIPKYPKLRTREI